MAGKQRLAPGFPFPVYVNETAKKERLAPGVYADETISTSPPPTSNNHFLLIMGCGT